MKFLHTSDWQMGMKAGALGLVAARVREARLEAARRVVATANDHKVDMILVTGDVFEDNGVDRLLVRKVGEVLRGFNGPVFIISGNHDPLMPGSVWEHDVWREPNLHVLRKAEPIELDQCTLFPCPLKEKYSTKNPTLWIDVQQSRKICIGLAHGNVEGIPNGEPDYPILRDTPGRCGLDFLALGHWHSFARYENAEGLCRMAYSGTHETTKFGERESGFAIIVEIAERGAAPQITPIKTGNLIWRILDEIIELPNSLGGLAQELSAMPSPENTLVRVDLAGIMFPEDRGALVKVQEVLASRFLFGALQAEKLIPAPNSDRWIESLPTGPFREAAVQIRQLAGQSANPEERAIATRALIQLFELQERASA